MSASNAWGRIAEQFDLLCELDPEQQQHRLDALAAEAPEVARRLRSMLAADAGVDQRIEVGLDAFLDADLVDSLERVLDDPEHSGGSFAAGDQIGSWRLDHRIGRGGMGEVWEAGRSDGAFQQAVALKILRRGLDTEDVLTRFLRERRLLARLQHPGIARLCDGGSTPDGRPWFAMELVEGRPLVEHCDAERLGLSARLRLFLEVCDAVEYAHRSLVIHRDLKPSNILVTSSGEAKLLDFGIAKVLVGDETEQDAPVTRATTRLLTPTYAAPEQLAGGEVTLATDVYALGVILYQLVSGLLPHELSAVDAGGLGWVMHRAPATRPSVAVRRAGGRTPVGDQSSSRLARRLAGDLDIIAITALAAEPQRRYPTAGALAEDIRRHLGGLPVLARPDSVGYRARKFARRHPVGVAATWIAVAIFAGTSGWYTARIVQERDRASKAAELAQAQFARAERARDFLVGLFQDADPMRPATDADRTVAELLRGASQRVDSELADQPELQAEMGIAIAGALRGLGELPPALELVAKSVERFRRLADTRSQKFASALSLLGQLRSATGDFEGAEAAVREAIDVLESLPPTVGVMQQLVSIQTGLGNILERTGRGDEALELREQLLDARAELLGDRDHEKLAVDWYNLGVGYQTMGRTVDAERALRGSARRLIEAHGETHPRLINVRLSLAAVLAQQGEFDAAAGQEEKAERLLGHHYADTHPLRGSLYMIRGRRLMLAGDDGAIPPARQAVELFRSANHFQVGQALSRLGAAQLAGRDFEGARASFAEALPVLDQQRGPEDRETRVARVGLAVARWWCTGDPAGLSEAATLLKSMADEGLAATREFADAAAWLAHALEMLAAGEADTWRLHAEQALATVYPPDHPWRISIAGTRR